jgi:hypothetical protein
LLNLFTSLTYRMSSRRGLGSPDAKERFCSLKEKNGIGERIVPPAASWDNAANWQYDPRLETEIELRFIPDRENATRVELEHRHLDRYGAHRDQMRRIFETEGDWERLLEMYARVAAA